MADADVAAARTAEGRAEYDLGPVSGLYDALGIVLALAWVGVAAGAGLWLARGSGSLALLAGALAGAVALHAGRAALRRGARLRVLLTRSGPEAAPVYEVRHGDAVEASGPFSPEHLHVVTVVQARGPAGVRPATTYRLLFRPEPRPSYPLYAEGFPLLDASAPARCTDEVLAILRALRIDPGDYLARIREPV